jgi:hypothetical protein
VVVREPLPRNVGWRRALSGKVTLIGKVMLKVRSRNYKHDLGKPPYYVDLASIQQWAGAPMWTSGKDGLIERHCARAWLCDSADRDLQVTDRRSVWLSPTPVAPERLQPATPRTATRPPPRTGRRRRRGTAGCPLADSERAPTTYSTYVLCQFPDRVGPRPTVVAASVTNQVSLPNTASWKILVNEATSFCSVPAPARIWLIGSTLPLASVHSSP